MLELQAIFKGRIQGVGFRAAACRMAGHLKLVGFVSNLPDGSVKLLAQGQEKELKLLIYQLKQKFIVSTVKECLGPIEIGYKNFEIKN